ncbi:discoidin domain-containing protein [Leifsonia aquatica]|uniref:F5/8 type C domain protein n=2 Tax=Leifsonia aquatica TaxID=144185 RepID=U2RE25_LEIAQ|nr:discoidin domain-containing protein [Leifsonia aquatica]ERK73500.1 f5/8 type C domain protein [Leifsonia aquatica ATCC 14665]MBB2967949.1 chitodextrinase [Leifsonia aquatica]
MSKFPRYPHAKNRPGFRARTVTATAVALLTGAALALVPVSAQAAPAAAVAHASLKLPPVSIYVAPTGNGVQLGTKAHPFRSLEAARTAARLINAPGLTDVNVVLADGTYKIDKTFALNSTDSGRGGHTVTYEAAPGAHPVISGGKDITGWKLSDATHGIYKVHVGNIDTRQLYVDGELETRARGGNNPPGFSKTATGYTITDTSLDALKNQSAIEVVSKWGWMEYRCPVQSIVGTAVTMQQPCWHNANLHEGQEIQNPTWLENAYEFLDTPGEWYLDNTAGDLYYMPKQGQDLSKATVTVPMVQDLVDLNGTIDKPVSNVAFQGITFSYSTWLAPSSADGMVEGQAGFRITGSNYPTFDSSRLYWQKTPGAVNVSYGHNISFTGNRFTKLGAVGLNLNTGTQGTNIVGNVFTDVAATGIQIGGVEVIDHHPTDLRSVTKNTLVSNNVVTNVATGYNGSLGILAGYTDSTTIEHNRVYNLPYSGISVGWGWGLTDKGGDSNYPGNSGVPVYDTPTTSRKTIVRDNSISDIMKSQADGGAIYTLSASPDSEVSGNLITDVPEPAYGAIYQDEGSRYWHTTNNAFCNIAYQWLLLNHGMDIIADRNFTTKPQYSAQFNSTNDTITNNVTVDSCAQLPASIVDNAGLQPAYRGLDPQPAPTDTTAPTAPGAPTGAANFPSVAELSWPAATDDTGVTGYSVFANGTLVSATGGTSARITGLTAGAAYKFTVTARDAAGNESKPSPAFTLTTPSGSDLAVGKPVTASSDSETNYPKNAVDGDLSTRWAQGLGLPDPSWIQVDLGKSYDISGVITTFEKASGYKYKIEASNDELTWRTIEDHTGTNTTAATNYTEPASPVAGRFVRLTITGTSGNGGSIYELEVYGAPAPSGDTTPPSTPAAPTASVQLPTLLDLSWPASTDDTGVTGYAVYDGTTQIALTTATTLRVGGLTPGSSHSYTVVARDASGNQSAQSSAAAVTLPADSDLAKGKPVTVSSFSEPNLPELAVDGDLSTRWAQGLGLPDPSWIQVDLGAVTSIKSAVTTFELPSGYQYLLEYSTDGTNWSTLEDHRAARTTDRTNYSFLAQPVDARYVRLTVTGSSGNGGSIYELQVYGGF